MTKLPEKDLISGTKTPKTTTGEMKDALGKLRDYLAELFGNDSADKETARKTLGIDLSRLATRMETETALLGKADKKEMDALETEMKRRGIPVGSIDYFAMAIPPAGYLKADGSEVGRETYPDLFAAIGTTFGAGDGSTTFNLPDLMGRFPQGSTTPGQAIEAGLPDITGQISGLFSKKSQSATCDISEINVTGMFYGEQTFSNMVEIQETGTPSWWANGRINSSASRLSPIYGNSDTVQPPALALLPCIKAFDALTSPGLIDISALTAEVNGKLGKTVNGLSVKYITETHDDGTNWYRKWSDGWLEQGGYNNTGTTGNVTLTFLKPFQSTPRIMVCGLEGSPNTSWWISGARSPTSLYVTGSVTGYQLGFDWYACGQAS